MSKIEFDNVPVKKKVHVSHATGNNDWYTPIWIIMGVRHVMEGIELDPASCARANEVVAAERYYDLYDNGLTQSWKADTLFLNPPYSRELITPFTEKLRDEWVNGNIGQACLLTNNATDTRWWQMISEYADAICFFKGRVRFWREDAETPGKPLQGQTIMYFGDRVSDFQKWFSQYGLTLRR